MKFKYDAIFNFMNFLKIIFAPGFTTEIVHLPLAYFMRSGIYENIIHT